MDVGERPKDEWAGMDQDVEWLSAYRRGDAEALGKLVDHYRRPLYAFILRMTEGRSDADEVFQEVWFRAIRNIGSYRDDRFLSWLFRIAHNLIIDRARKARPMVGLADSDGGDAIENKVASPEPSPAGDAAGRDLGRRIAEAVRKLPPEQRAVFLMRMEGDVPFREIAKIQGTSINTALARMQYALQKLRAELKGDFEALGRS
jgi:RNA polymerase sigma-70 factor (ECF subfamily)